jgi:hypothetical protein
VKLNSFSRERPPHIRVGSSGHCLMQSAAGKAHPTAHRDSRRRRCAVSFPLATRTAGGLCSDSVLGLRAPAFLAVLHA